MLLGDFLQDFMNRGNPDRVDLAAGERVVAPYTPNPEPLPGILGNLTDYGRLADAFRANNNPITSAVEWISFTNALAGMKEDPNFDVFRDYDFKGMEKFAYQFGWAKSREQADEVRKRLIEDMAARQRFSDLDPLTQFVVGAIASTGPADVVPFGIGRGILAGGAIAGAAIGAQSLARHSMALQPGDWTDAAFDAATGALFTGGYNAARRLLSPQHAPGLEGIARARDAEVPLPTDRGSAGALRAEEMAPARRADAEPGPFVVHDGDLTVRPGPDGPVEMPRGDGHQAPRFIDETGGTTGGKADFTDDRPVPSSRSLNFVDPVMTDGGRVYDLRRGPAVDGEPPPIVTGDDVMARPSVLITRGGITSMRAVPSPAEIVQGRLSAEPAKVSSVRVSEGAELAAADQDAIKAGRPVVIGEETSPPPPSRGGILQHDVTAWRGAPVSEEATGLGLQRGVDETGRAFTREVTGWLAQSKETAQVFASVSGGLINEYTIRAGTNLLHIDPVHPSAEALDLFRTARVLQALGIRTQQLLADASPEAIAAAKAQIQISPANLHDGLADMHAMPTEFHKLAIEAAGYHGTTGFTDAAVRATDRPNVALFDNSRARWSRIVSDDDSSVGARQYGNVWTDNDSRLAAAGGLEKIRLTPAAANLSSPVPEVRESMAALANHAMVVEGNTRGLAGQQSVEARHMALNAPRIVDTVHGWWGDYAEYARSVGGGAMGTGISRTLDFVGTRLANIGNGPSYKDFMREVAAAIVDGGQHANAVVSRAAQRFGAVADDLRAQATQVGYWDFLFQLRIDDLKARRRSAQDPNKIARLDHEIGQAQADQLRTQATGGPTPQTDRGYLPRYYRYDKIMAERGQVEAIIDARIQQLGGVSDPVTGLPYTGKQAVDILLNIDPATGAPRAYVKPKGDQWAHSGKERGFDWIPTKMLWDYVETDAEVLLRRYVRQMGVDVEITRQFGDPFMMREIQRLAAAGASQRELENVMFVRDVIKGAHAPMDPTSIITHSVQAAKMVANMTVLGAQTITAFTDLARPFMAEGIQRTLGTTFDLISDGFHGMKLHRAEAEALGSSGEMVLALRQQAFANGSSAFAATPGWLQGIERMHSAFFMLNGIAPWTETMKTWQSVITTTRIMEDIRLAAAGRLGDAEMQRLATIGLDAKIAGDIVTQLDRHEVHLGRTSLPNVGAWDSGEAVERFRTAVWQATNRSIVTPGAADIPRWTVEGTSWLPAGAAQVIAMYHNYGVALHHKLVVSGLQGADANFLAGALALVGLGYMVDHIRDELNTVNDRKPRFKSTGERLAAAVDRSGLLGYATNVNNAIERLSFNTVGVKPFTGQVRWGEGSVVAAAGGLGPVGSWAGNLFRVVNGEAHDRRGWSEAQAMRKMLPLNTLFWMDGLFDRIQEDWYDPTHEKTVAAEQRKRYAARRTTAHDGE